MIVPKELVDAVDQLAGKRGRSRFFTEAVEEKLARARRATILKNAAGALADREIPGWETSEAAAAWVRRSRQADDRRLERLEAAR
ncbi:MAG: hypothetical protein HY332_06230 [Chloroflexi bacterium]|nr:hypothetical protein [Chloroflexota bacterium]